MYLMNVRGNRYLVAYDDNNKLAGIITLHDILRQVLANKHHAFDDALTSGISVFITSCTIVSLLAGLLKQGYGYNLFR